MVSAGVFGLGEGAKLLGVDVSQLFQLPLASSIQILDVHHVCLLDARVLLELIADSGEEARFVLTGSQELPVQRQDLLLQLAVPHHHTKSTSERRTQRNLIKEPLRRALQRHAATRMKLNVCQWTQRQLEQVIKPLLLSVTD